MKKLWRAIWKNDKPSDLSREERRHGLVGPTNLWKMKRDFQFAFLTERGLEKNHGLLDIGCGTLRGGIPLIEFLDAEGYWGIDVRAEALDEGRKELAEAGLESRRPQLVHSVDLSRLELDRKFNAIWSFSVLIHMSDDILRGVLGFVGHHLEHDGTFYANVNIGEEPERVWREFPVVWRSLDFYRSECAAHGLAVKDLGPLGDLGHVSGVESQDAQRMLAITVAG